MQRTWVVIGTATDGTVRLVSPAPPTKAQLAQFATDAAGGIEDALVADDAATKERCIQIALDSGLVNPRVVERSTLPDVRTYRAWVDDGVSVKVDLARVKEMWQSRYISQRGAVPVEIVKAHTLDALLAALG